MITRIIDYQGVYKGIHIFQTNGGVIRVKSHEDGIFEIDVPYKTPIGHIAELTAGCFDPGSNFDGIVGAVFNSLEDLKGIRFLFNKVDMLVTSENANPKQIVQSYWDSSEELGTKREQEAAKYRAERIKALKDETRRNAVEKRLTAAQENIEIEFKDDEGCKQRSFRAYIP